ncbi:MAG: hypothetical protein JNL98_21255 [Bryobacterales bacterium]|nr:hypothetical protein [Bryobacterales bacterium]
MARKAKSIATRWQELTGERYILPVNAIDEEPLRWHWIDYPVLSFSDVLAFTGLPKGRIESYSRRGLWDLTEVAETPGSGHHVLYSPRNVLKLLAIDRLAQAGAWPECLKAAFETNRDFDLILNGFQCRDFDIRAPYNPTCEIHMNDEVWAHFRSFGRFPDSSDLIESCVTLTFDVRLFLRGLMPKFVRFFAEAGVKVDD